MAQSMYAHESLKPPITNPKSQTDTPPDYLIAFLRSFILPASLGGSKTNFTPTGSIPTTLHERSRQNTAPLLRRLRVTLLSHYALIHLLFILATLTGLSLNLARTLSPAQIPNLWSSAPIETPSQRLEFFVTRLGWPPVFWLQFVVSAATPIVYAFWPPVVPEREALLERDEKTGVAYPKAESRGVRRSGAGWWRYVRGAVVMGWTLAVFVGNEVL